MTSSKSTKRALVSSALAILMCVAMLIGTTFAWFTDTASTAVNKIQAGNLDIEVSFAKEAKNDDGTLKGELTEFKTIEDATDVFDNNALWEPGRIEYVVFKIENKGNLALKYKFNLAVIAQKAGINVANEKYMLADYLCASAKIDNGPGVVDSGYQDMGTADLTSFMTKMNDLNMTGYVSTATPAEKPLNGINLEGTLGTKETDKINCVCMAVWMPTTVGNEANAIDTEHTATIDLGIHVVATQNTVEHDSFGNQYDADAKYPATVAEIAAKYKADASVVPAGFVVEEKTNSEFDSGNKATGTITIKDAESLLYFAYVLDPAAAHEKCLADHTGQWGHTCVWYGGAYARHIKLDADIDLANIILPNGFGNMKDFDFDGQDHTIKNVTISNSGNRNIGLFQGGNRGISNLVVENVNVLLTGATGDSAAGIVSSDANANISNVTVKNSSVTGGKWTGGIVGYNYGSITNCAMVNCTVSGQYKVGGIVGYLCSAKSTEPIEVTGNKLMDVTVKGENVLSGKTLAIGKLVGNWNVIAGTGTCKDNTFSGATEATANIGLKLGEVTEN